MARILTREVNELFEQLQIIIEDLIIDGDITPKFVRAKVHKFINQAEGI